ncbi:MAG TPA: DUF4157 domain-containing protein [Mycobacteriales bacterium]|nr:DUF4157 domain-containing protein [Mycobacteriales bacterium]
MRWPFRRRGRGGPGPVAAEPAPARASGRDWAALPPLRPASRRHDVLTAGPAPVLPPLPGERAVAGADVPPATGRVDGLASVLPAPAPAPMAAGPAGAPGPALPTAPLVYRRTVVTLPAHQPLTLALDEYVGPAREPAEPSRPPSWLRGMAPPWLAQDDPAGFPSPFAAPAEPEPPEPPAATAATTTLVSSAPVAAEEDVELARPGPRRRMSLGQSRRLGLGAPISRPAGEPFTLPVEMTELVEPAEPVVTQPPAAVEQLGAVEPPWDPPPGPAAGMLQEPEPEPEPEPADQPAHPSAAVTVPPPADRPRAPARALAPGEPPLAMRVRPVYHAAPATRATPPPPTVLRPAPTRVPTDLASALRDSHGVDVADVQVYRGPDVAAEARSRGARAFTRGGAVFLPAEAGPADAPATRGLLAHELVHAVQQRALGAGLPAPDTHLGQALEAEAVAAERWHGGEPGAPEPPPLIHPHRGSGPWVSGEPDLGGHVQLAPVAPVAPAVPSAPSFSSTLTSADRDEIHQIANRATERVVEQWTNPALAGGSGAGHGGSSQQQYGLFFNEDGSVEAVVPSATGGRTQLTSVNIPGSGANTRAAGAGAAGTGHPAAGPATGGAATAPAGGGFNREARRAELERTALAQANALRTARGEPEQSFLSLEEQAAVDRQLDQEQAMGGSAGAGAGGGGGGGGSGQAPFGLAYTDDGSVEAVVPSATGGRTQLTTFDPPGGAGGGAGAASGQAAAGHQAGGPAQLQSGAAAGHDGQQQLSADHLDLDHVATALYDRLRSRLRLELLIDRERAGLLTDFR